MKEKSKNGQKIIQYLTWFKGYTADSDKWLTSSQLRNVPEILEQWKNIRNVPRLTFDNRCEWHRSYLCSKAFHGE